MLLYTDINYLLKTYGKLLTHSRKYSRSIPVYMAMKYYNIYH